MTPEQINHRAGGRRHYNSHRQYGAAYRRYQVARLLNETAGQFGGFLGKHGQIAAIAHALGVHPSTISRDAAALQAEWLASSRPCPLCGGTISPLAYLRSGCRDEDDERGRA